MTKRKDSLGVEERAEMQRVVSAAILATARVIQEATRIFPQDVCEMTYKEYGSEVKALAGAMTALLRLSGQLVDLNAENNDSDLEAAIQQAETELEKMNDNEDDPESA